MAVQSFVCNGIFLLKLLAFGMPPSPKKSKTDERFKGVIQCNFIRFFFHSKLTVFVPLNCYLKLLHRNQNNNAGLNT